MLGFFLIIGYSDNVRLRKTFILLSFIAAFYSDVQDLITHTSCPDCYSDELCEPFEKGKVEIYWMSKIVAIINPEFTKSVFFATTEDHGDIVIKSMAQRAFLTSNSSKFKSSENIIGDIIKDNILRSNDEFQNVVLCPNIESFHQIFQTIDKDLTYLAHKNHLWLDVPVSIEPILLKFLSQVPNLNVPKFYGACGDLIFTEFKGNPLINYFNSNWEQRLFLSLQLLEMADSLTFFHPSLIFYLTDISPDNIVVNSSGIISVIDLDSVIISERMKYENNALMDDVHTSRVIDPMYLTVSPSEICEHRLSDHNYYAVCKYILLDTGAEFSGLLNNIPHEILQDNPDFTTLLEECGTPKMLANRIAAGKHLKEILKQMLSVYDWDKNF